MIVGSGVVLGARRLGVVVGIVLTRWVLSSRRGRVVVVVGVGA